MFQTWFIDPHITNRDWETEPPQNTTERLNATLDHWWRKILQVVQAYNRVSSTYLADRALCCRPDQFIPLEIEFSPPFRSYDRMASSREELHGVIWWLQKVLVHIGPVHYMPMYERLPYSCVLLDSAHLPLLPLE
jgi:hypothetical protein